jgi:hypothetical protein
MAADRRDLSIFLGVTYALKLVLPGAICRCGAQWRGL